MSNLYLYACSYGKYGTSLGPDANVWTNEKSFGELLSKRLDLNFINRSWTGGCNFHIFKNIMKDVVDNNFKPTDVVIVQWTYLARAYYRDQTETVMPHNSKFQDYYKDYYSDLQSLCNLLTFNHYASSKIKSNYYFSIVENLDTIKNINELIYTEFVNDSKFITYKNMSPIEYLQTSKDDSLLLDCKHPSLLGHKMLSDIFYNHIMPL